jgi:ProP effector
MTKRITKTELNKLAKSLYGEEVHCEHTRTGFKRGWYLHKGSSEPTFIGVNATEAFNDLQFQENDLQSQENVTEMRPTLVAPFKTQSTKPSIKKEGFVAKKPVKKPKSATTETSSKDEEAKTISPEELLEILLEKFPKAFSRKVEEIRPLQKYIHKKIRQALNCEYTKNEIASHSALNIGYP